LFINQASTVQANQFHRTGTLSRATWLENFRST
jgi:hypothetical protein